jgi:hypothetical protein
MAAQCNSLFVIGRTVSNIVGQLSIYTFAKLREPHAKFSCAGEQYAILGRALDGACRLRQYLQPPAHRESVNNLTPADVYFGRGQAILLEGEKIKRRTIELRRLRYASAAA